VGKNFNKERNTVCLLLLVSFVAGIIGVYFNKVGGVRFGRYAIFAAIALVPVTFLYLRKLYEVLNAGLLASLGGLTFGAGVGLTGVWYVSENPSRMWLGPKWLLIGGILIAAFVYSVKSLHEAEPKEDLVPNEDFKILPQLEQLKQIEKLFVDDSAYQPLTKAPVDHLGLAFCGVGLVTMVSVIVSTESNKNRLIMIAILVAVIPICVWTVTKLRRRSLKKFDALLVEMDMNRQKALEEIRAEIAKLEASPGDEQSSPAETN
jgi:hypothetical protein